MSKLLESVNKRDFDRRISEVAEKQIPKKPIFDYNLSDTLSKFHCECGKTIKVNHDVGIMDDNDAPNYCSDCGQELDWSEESEENNEID